MTGGNMKKLRILVLEVGVDLDHKYAADGAQLPRPRAAIKGVTV